MRGTFYGHNPLYDFGEKVIYKDETGEKHLAQIESIIFTRDEETGEIIYYYDIVLCDELGMLLTVDEDDLEPYPGENKADSPAIVEEPGNTVNYEEYTVDELLDAYNRFKEAPRLFGKRKDRYFTKKMKDIEEILKRKTAGKGKR